MRIRKETSIRSSLYLGLMIMAAAALAVTPAWGDPIAITVDKDAGAHAQGGSGIDSTVATFTPSWSESLNGSNGLLVLFLSAEGTPSSPPVFSDVTYTPSGGDPVALSAVPNTSVTATETYVNTTVIYSLLLGDRAGETGTVSLTVTCSSYALASLAFYEVDQANPIAATATNSTLADVNNLTTAITVGTGTLVADIITDNENHTWTPNSGQTEQWDLTGGTTLTRSSMAVGTRDVTGDVSNKWTASANWARATHSMIALNAVPEPATMCLLALGGVGQILRIRRRRK